MLYSHTENIKYPNRPRRGIETMTLNSPICIILYSLLMDCFQHSQYTLEIQIGAIHKGTSSIASCLKPSYIVRCACTFYHNIRLYARGLASSFILVPTHIWRSYRFLSGSMELNIGPEQSYFDKKAYWFKFPFKLI